MWSINIWVPGVLNLLSSPLSLSDPQWSSPIFPLVIPVRWDLGEWAFWKVSHNAVGAGCGPTIGPGASLCWPGRWVMHSEGSCSSYPSNVVLLSLCDPGCQPQPHVLGFLNGVLSMESCWLVLWGRQSLEWQSHMLHLNDVTSGCLIKVEHTPFLT